MEKINVIINDEKYDFDKGITLFEISEKVYKEDFPACTNRKPAVNCKPPRKAIESLKNEAVHPRLNHLSIKTIQNTL